MSQYALINDGVINRLVVNPSPTLQYGPHPNRPRLPYLLPVEVIDPPFNPITEVKEGPVYAILDDKVTMEFTVRPKTAEEIGEMRSAKIAEIHSEGERRLSAVVTLARQVQSLTRLVQMIYLHTDTSGWPAPQQTLATTMLNRLSNIQNIRQTEEAKVGEVGSMTDPVAIDAYDVTAGW